MLMVSTVTPGGRAELVGAAGALVPARRVVDDGKTPNVAEGEGEVDLEVAVTVIVL